jgi:hypothetical protein
MQKYLEDKIEALELVNAENKVCNCVYIILWV